MSKRASPFLTGASPLLRVAAFNPDAYLDNLGKVVRKTNAPDLKKSLLSADAEPLKLSVVWSYAIGHHLNDLCAATWFTYLLVYLEDEVGLSEITAGLVMLSGQFADALATPTVGLLSDGTPPYCQVRALGLGRRKIWHALGTVIVVLCFGLMVFSGYSPFDITSEAGLQANGWYLALGAALFNVGWAAVQVSFLSLMPELHPHYLERTRLQSAAYASTVAANLEVFFLFYICSGHASHPFRIMSIAITLIGGGTTLVFHRMISEKGFGEKGAAGE